MRHLAGRRWWPCCGWSTVVAAVAFVFVGCRDVTNETTSSRSVSPGQPGKLAGEIQIDGSSTVFPVSRAMAEEFQKEHPEVRVVVSEAGTSGGFKRFVRGELDICDASRPIVDSEAEAAKRHGIDAVELRVAIDGLSVVVNPANDWVDCLTIEQLKTIWAPDSTVKTWKDVDPNWPDEEIRLYGPGPDSGTFDYFTEVVVGKAKASRTDYTPSEDDNVLVQGVAGDKYSLGYFGYAYYAENKEKLKVVGISDGQQADCVKPSEETILSGQYTPLSRPLFLYVSQSALKRPEVAAFLRFYLGDGQELVPEVGYVRISPEVHKEMQERLEQALAAAGGGK